jgi:hypothetical protein
MGTSLPSPSRRFQTYDPRAFKICRCQPFHVRLEYKFAVLVKPQSNIAPFTVEGSSLHYKMKPSFRKPMGAPTVLFRLSYMYTLSSLHLLISFSPFLSLASVLSIRFYGIVQCSNETTTFSRTTASSFSFHDRQWLRFFEHEHSRTLSSASQWKGCHSSKCSISDVYSPTSPS